MGLHEQRSEILRLASINEEKRDFTRIPVHAKAKMILGNQFLEGEVENMSLKGAFVRLPGPPALNNSLMVTISDTLTSLIICDLKAKVVRVTEHGVGLQFEKTIVD